MIKSNKHIEIVRSETRGLSYLSRESCASILAVLSKHFTEVGVTVVNNLADLEVLASSQPDLVFLGMEFIPANPNKIWLSDVLANHHIPHTGSARAAHELERHKHLAKQRVLEADLPTSAFFVIRRNRSLNKEDVSLDYPLFIKPVSRGGGVGVDSDSVVHNFEQLRSKVRSITTKLQSDVLIEEYLPGREFSVAILKDSDSAKLLAMPIELVAPADYNGSRLLSGRVKSSNAEQALEVTDPVVKSQVSALALAVFEALGARDYGRIDIRLNAAGMPHFLEANLIPSLISGYGSFPKACMLNIGLEYEPMIMRIAELGLAHKINNLVNVTKSTVSSRPIIPSVEVTFEPV